MDSINYKALGIKIKEMRKRRNLSQEKLSEIVGISTNYLSRVETCNGGVVSLPTLVKIANALSASMDYLLSDSLSHSNDANNFNVNALSEDDKEFVKTIICQLINYKTKLLLTVR